MSDGIVFDLSEPIEVVTAGQHGPRAERTIVAVTLRSPGSKDLLLLEKHRGNPITLVREAIAALGEITPAQAGKLAGDDFETIGAVALQMLATANAALGLPPGWYFIPAK